MAKNDISIGVGVVNNATKGLNAILNDATKWSASMSKLLQKEVSIAMPNMSGFADSFKKAESLVRSNMKKFSYATEYFTKKRGISQGIRVFEFDPKKLNYEYAKNSLKELLELRARLDDVSKNGIVKDKMSANDRKNLDALIKSLTAATDAYKALETEKKRAMRATSEAAFNKQVWTDGVKRRKEEQRQEEQFNKQVFQDGVKRRKEAQRQAIRDEKLDFLNKNIIGSAQTAQNASAPVEKRIQAERELSQLLNKRYQLTKNIKDLEASRAAGSRARAMSDQLKADNKALAERERRTKEVNGLFERQSGILGRLRSQLAMYFSIYGLINLGKKIVETTGYFEQQKVALEGITGSAAAANKVLNDIKSFALRSPFETKDLIGFTKQLSAFSVPTDQLFDVTKRLADLSAGLGVDMSRIVLAYGQVRSAAVLRGQELRQFTEAGIPMVEALRKKLQELNGEYVTAGQVFEAISKRQVSFEMVNEVLMNMTKEGGQFYKMQENITNTLYGQVQKLKDVWTLSMQEIGSSSQSVLSWIVARAQDIAKNFKQIADIIIFTVAGRALGALTQGISHLITLTKTFFTSLSLVSFTNWVTMALTAIGVVVGGIVALVDKTNKLDKKFKEIEDSFDKENLNKARGLSSLLSKLNEATKSTKEYSDALETLKQNYGDYLTDAMLKKLDDEKQKTGKIAEAWKEIANQINEAIVLKNKYHELEQKESAAANDVADWIAGLNHRYLSSILGTSTGNANYDDRYNFENIGMDKTSLANGLKEALQDAWSWFTSSDDKSEEALAGFIKRAIGMAMPEFAMQNQQGVNNIISRAVSLITGLDGFSSMIEQNTKKNGELISVIDRTFKATDPSRQIAGYSTLSNAERERKIAELYIQDAKVALEELFKGSVNTKGLNEWKTLMGGDGKEGLINESLKNFKTDSVYKISKAMEELANKFSGSNASKFALWVNEVSAALNNAVANISGRAAEVKALGQSFSAVWSQNSNVEQLRKYYIDELTNENYDERRNSLPTKLKELQGSLNYQNRQQTKDVAYIKKLEDQILYVKELMRPSMFNVQQKKTGGSTVRQSSPGYRKFFSDLFGLIKEANSEQKKLIEAYDGVTASLLDDVNALENSPLKDFYSGIGGNPFQKFFDKIEEYGLGVEGIFTSDDFKDLTNRYKEGVGPDGIDIADFGAIWEDLIKIIQKKIDALAKDAKNKSTVNALTTFLESMTKEGMAIQGKDEIEDLITEAVKSLTRIESGLDYSRKQYSVFESLSESGSYKDAWKALFGGDAYFAQDFSEDLRKGIIEMLDSKGGAGINAYVPGLRGMLSAGRLNISSLPKLFDFIQQIQDIQKLAGVDGKQLKEAKDKFIKYLEELAEEIQKDWKALQDTRTRNEKNADKLENAQRKRNDKYAAINREMSQGNMTQDEWESRIEEARQGYVKDITEALGGVYDEAIANITKEFTATGSSGAGDFLQMLSSKQSGGLKGVMSNVLSTATANGLDASMASEAMGNFNGAIAVIEAIFKAIDGIFKTLQEFYEKYERYQISGQNARVISKDAAGNLTTVDNFNEQQFERSKKSFEIFNEFNDNAQKGWEATKNGDFIGSVMYGLVYQVMDMVAGFRELNDLKLQQKIDELNKLNEQLQRSNDYLQWQENFRAGADVIRLQAEEIANMKKEVENLRDIYNTEAEMKGADADKLQELEDATNAAERAMLDMIRQIREEILGTADDLASTLTDAFVNAFRNGENAARAWRDTVKSYIGDMLKDFLLQKFLAPRIQEAFDSFTDGVDVTNVDQMKNLLSNPGKVNALAQELIENGDWLAEEFQKLPKSIQDYITFNSQSKALSGGIENITEDTARRLEALNNSQLAVQIQIRDAVYMLANTSSPSGAPGRQYALDAQTISDAMTQSSIGRDVNAILVAITDMRNGVRPMHVIMN